MKIFSKIYQWHRYWNPPESIVRLTAKGYPTVSVHDPDFLYPSTNKSFQQIEKIPCLVLLGQPGSGKSTWLEAHKDSLEDQIQSRHGQMFVEDLGRFTSFDSLRKEIFESQEFSRWRKGRHRLHLFLDSLDQLAARVQGSPRELVGELQKCPVERLCLRILCRAAEWPQGLEDRLKELYEEEILPDVVKIYTLGPLTEDDVIEAAVDEGLSDPVAFLQEIEARKLVPFAIRPRTLGFLIGMHKKAAGLPRDQVEVYKTGCRILCDEPNQDRRDEKRLGNLGVEEKLALASRIAALALLCNKDLIWTGSEGSFPSDGMLSFAGNLPWGGKGRGQRPESYR